MWVTCLMCLWFSVGLCSESDHLIKTTVSPPLPPNINGDFLYSAKPDKVQNITESEWDSLVLRSELPALVMFTAEECGECRKMDDLLNILDVLYKGRFKFYKIDFNKGPVIVERYSVTDVPTTYYLQRRRYNGSSHRILSIESNEARVYAN